jgi:hypothetical protein
MHEGSSTKYFFSMFARHAPLVPKPHPKSYSFSWDVRTHHSKF